MNKLLIIVLIIGLSGCAISTQHFSDISYTPDGSVVREVNAKSRTWSPPLKNARSFANHSLDMQEIGADWAIHMGSDNDLVGGDRSLEFIKAINLISGI